MPKSVSGGSRKPTVIIPLVQVEWTVVAGPPGTPSTMVTWENPDRMKKGGAS